MKRSVSREYNQLQEKLTGYVAMLNFRFMNLCIKAEEASLLPVSVVIGGASKKLEEVAVIAKKADYHFVIVPNHEDELKDVGRGIAMSHPEFKQDVESLHIEANDVDGNPMDNDVPYILATMPEVNDERYDILKEGVDMFYQECKTHMEKAILHTKGQISMQIIGEPAEDVDQVNKAVDKLVDEKNSQRDKLREEKLQEIEEAYKKWQAEQARKNPQNAENEKAMHSMRMTPENEEY